MKTKQALDFIALTSIASPCACVFFFFANLISKSVSRTIFADTQLVYFIWKLVILVIPDQEKVVFVSFCAV